MDSIIKNMQWPKFRILENWVSVCFSSFVFSKQLLLYLYLNTYRITVQCVHYCKLRIYVFPMIGVWVCSSIKSGFESVHFTVVSPFFHFEMGWSGLCNMMGIRWNKMLSLPFIAFPLNLMKDQSMTYPVCFQRSHYPGTWKLGYNFKVKYVV